MALALHYRIVHCKHFVFFFAHKTQAISLSFSFFLPLITNTQGIEFCLLVFLELAGVELLSYFRVMLIWQLWHWGVGQLIVVSYKNIQYDTKMLYYCSINVIVVILVVRQFLSKFNMAFSPFQGILKSQACHVLAPFHLLILQCSVSICT